MKILYFEVKFFVVALNSGDFVGDCVVEIVEFLGQHQNRLLQLLDQILFTILRLMVPRNCAEHISLVLLLRSGSEDFRHLSRRF